MSESQRRPPPETEPELWVRARALSGRNVAELAMALNVTLPAQPKRAKGFVGNLVELALGADPTAGERPDFTELGVELKTVPVNSAARPIESTFCCSIEMSTVDTETWEHSRLRARLRRVLFIPVQRSRNGGIGQRRFGEPCFWTPSPAQLDVLRADWEDAMGAIALGDVPTAHSGVALQVRPKAANSRSRALCAASSGPVRRLPLGFYLRARFVAGLLARPDAARSK